MTRRALLAMAVANRLTVMTLFQGSDIENGFTQQHRFVQEAVLYTSVTAAKLSDLEDVCEVV